MKVAGISLPRANKRLKTLFDEATRLSNGDVVADIGADHGYLAVMLKNSNKFERVIATDISAPSLEKTVELAKSLNLDIDCRVGDGLLVAPDATMACVCGMGGYEIIKILNQQSKVQKFVLQPVQNAIELRLYLLKNHYKIVSDYVIEDKNKFYNILCVSGKGLNFYSRYAKLFGKENFRVPSEDFTNYLQNQINKLKFLEKFDITIVDGKEKKIIRKKIRYYKLCKKILEGSAV